MSTPSTLRSDLLERPSVSLGNLLLGLGVLALGAHFTYGAFNIEVAVSYSRVGPRVFPFLVASGLLVCGALLVI